MPSDVFIMPCHLLLARYSLEMRAICAEERNNPVPDVMRQMPERVLTMPAASGDGERTRLFFIRQQLLAFML